MAIFVPMKVSFDRIFVGIAMAATAILPACTTNTPSNSNQVVESSTSGDIVIAVDETFQPIIAREITAFQNAYPKANIRAIYLPGEDAIDTMLKSDKIRLAIAVRTLDDEEISVLKSQSTSLKSSHIATDAIAAIAHKSNPDSVLTAQQFKDILTGKITSWKQINPASKFGEIELIFDNPQSSTYQFIRDTLLAGTAISPKKAYSAKTNEGVVESVKKNPNALGIMGVSWISDEDDTKKVVLRKDIRPIAFTLPENSTCKLKGSYTALQPYQAAIYYPDCYPMRRHVVALLRETRTGLGTGFVAYLAGPDGQRVIRLGGLATAHGIARVVRFPDMRKTTAK